MNAHATIQPNTDLAPDIEIAALDATMARAEQDKADADHDIDVADEAILTLHEAKDELERQIADINAAILDEGRARGAAIERWRASHVTLIQAHDRKSQLLVRETR
ncbi:hypothetical protein [Pelagibacterium luteolum]|uniref:Uncharacterized protein n=1 Tax=Pelagibacterium luteolum TaxID=440168 RepID=A0A1G7TJ64_9HYPH|nr:hypothetical protein [Pelagibacterium luteolum]SDG35054.1 hypothetical protein SAMN04487974_102147 [Pelagibacterium luteolum]